MDDIVKRLRSGGTPQVGGKLMTWEKQCAEAADEIERLQAFIDAAFEAHPNLDLDVDRINAQRDDK